VTLDESLQRAAQRRGDKVAVVCHGDSITYADLRDHSMQLAARLQAAGVVTGDRVVILLPNSIEAVESIFGVWLAGGVLVFADADTPAASLAHRLENSGAAAIVTTTTRLGVATTAAAARPTNRKPAMVLIDVADPTDHLATFRPQTVDDHAPAAIIYTSGSTGLPKGVTHSHHSISTVVRAVTGYLEHDEHDVVLSVLPLAFGYGLLQLLVTVQCGGRLVLRRGVGFPFDLVNLIDSESVTGLAAVPTLLVMLSDLDTDTTSTSSTSSTSTLRYITSAAAALPASLARRVCARFPSARLFAMHGQTECLRTTFMPPEELASRPTSVGRGIDGIDLWLEDGDGQRLAAPAIGELVVRGDNVMLGYWNDTRATSEVVSPGRTPHERTLRTGDLFRVDADGFFHFVSRTDDIIKTRGEKVAPHEIEMHLANLEAVAEARVFGVPDDLLGEAVVAEIVLREGQTLTQAEVQRHLRMTIEPVKVPKIVQFVDALPKSTNGKVLRRAQNSQPAS